MKSFIILLIFIFVQIAQAQYAPLQFVEEYNEFVVKDGYQPALYGVCHASSNGMVDTLACHICKDRLQMDISSINADTIIVFIETGIKFNRGFFLSHEASISTIEALEDVLPVSADYIKAEKLNLFVFPFDSRYQFDGDREKRIAVTKKADNYLFSHSLSQLNKPIDQLPLELRLCCASWVLRDRILEIEAKRVLNKKYKNPVMLITGAVHAALLEGYDKKIITKNGFENGLQYIKRVHEIGLASRRLE